MPFHKEIEAKIKAIHDRLDNQITVHEKGGNDPSAGTNRDGLNQQTVPDNLW